MQIDALYRYPVKGLTEEALVQADLHAGRCIPWDRAFALAQGDCDFDETAPAWRPKTEFLCAARNVEATWLNARFDEDARILTLIAPDGAAIDASPFTSDGRETITSFIAAALPTAMRGEPRFVHVPGHSFCDNKSQVVSLIGMPSLASLEAAAGAPRQRLRFRANVYLTGLDPWAELGWIGQTIAIGNARLQVTAPINRCAATTVNPETKQRDANPVKELKDHFGHIHCGVYARVIEPGAIARGDPIGLIA